MYYSTRLSLQLWVNPAKSPLFITEIPLITTEEDVLNATWHCNR